MTSRRAKKRHATRVGLSQQMVKRGLVSMDNGAGSISSRYPQRSRTLSTVQILAQRSIIAEGTTDAALTLNQKRRGDRERPATSVDLSGPLWGAQFGESTLAELDVQGPEQETHSYSADDVVAGPVCRSLTATSSSVSDLPRSSKATRSRL